TENAFLVLERLNTLGIKSVSGDLVIVPPFYFNFDSSATHSGAKLQAIFEGKGSTASAWEHYLTQSGREWTEFTGITFAGYSRVEDQSFITDRMRLLITHLSEPLSDLLKKQNDFSNNFMAEAVGRAIGGPHAIERFLIEEAGLSANEVHIST